MHRKVLSRARSEGESAATTNVPEQIMESNEKETTAEVVNETNQPEVAAEAASVVDMEIKAPVEEKVVTAHDDFDWSVDKRNVTSYTAAEKEKYDSCLRQHFQTD